MLACLPDGVKLGERKVDSISPGERRGLVGLQVRDMNITITTSVMDS